jgi:hypothetical protein
MKKRTRRRNPTFAITGGSVLTGALVIAAAVAGVMLYRNRAEILAWGKTALNPASTDNLAYKGATAITQAVTGNKVDSFGTWLANVFKPSAEKEVDAMLAPVPGADLVNRSYYDMGAKPKVINSAGTLVSSEWRDAVR